MEKEHKWIEVKERIAHIHAEGGYAGIAERNPQTIQEIGARPPECVCCMDGRIAMDKNAIAIAGSGILIKDDPVARALFVESLRARGIKKVDLHDDCGAVGIYAKVNGISRELAEKEAAEWAGELTKEIGGEGEIEVLPVSLDFHPEVCAYLVLTDQFSLAGIDAFPAGFRTDCFCSQYGKCSCSDRCCVEHRSRRPRIR